ncbi:hypothetical protein O181_024218 [Austropuccinia psidii MF-1]|uniref:Uncharacterized protein n=1 Tax=Austropuccinia psidii MF-1 TaxID=1389203 RepID=A0A9Q3CIJ1_9BASI|nr:hypothetical protein [Austropuccinia psidii MF-1]
MHKLASAPPPNPLHLLPCLRSCSAPKICLFLCPHPPSTTALLQHPHPPLHFHTLAAISRYSSDTTPTPAAYYRHTPSAPSIYSSNSTTPP